MAGGLFQEFNPIQRVAANQMGLVTNQITRGSLISFHYPESYAMIPNIIHDPYPMVIITDVWPKYIRGLNLHYLTFPYVKNILGHFAGNPGFTYFHVRPDKYMAQAFRMYVRAGVRQPKRLDTEWLKTVLNSVKSFAPGELEKIRTEIQRQIQARLQAKANELTSYEQWRKQLSESQKRQFRGKTLETQRILTGGVDRELIYPNEGPTGLYPSQQSPLPGQGGPYSTNENL